MNSDRAGSFLCSFQTFQSFTSSALPGTRRMYYPRHGTFARWCAAKLTVRDVVQRCTKVHVQSRAWATPSCSTYQ